MSALLPFMTVLLCLAMLVAAVVAVRGKELPIAILASGLVSLTASVLFLILASPDVAMTEAAIGSGLTTFLFFFVLSRLGTAPGSEEAPEPPPEGAKSFLGRPGERLVREGEQDGDEHHG